MVKGAASLVEPVASRERRISTLAKAIGTETKRIARDAVAIVTMAIRFAGETIRLVRVVIRFATRAIRFGSAAIRVARRAIRLARVVIRFAGPPIRLATRPIRIAKRTIRFVSREDRASRGAIRVSSLAIRFSSGYKGFMEYTMADLERATGLSARTIRQYMADGFLEPPKRKGLGAVYPEATFLKAVAIARMRAQGEDWKTVGARLRNWPLKRLSDYVASTEPRPPDPPVPPPQPAPPAVPPPEPTPPSTPALEGEPVTPPPRLPHASSPSREDLEARNAGDEEWLPDGPRWVLAPLLPGLALWVREDAAPIVRRTAAEIVRRYGSP